MLPGFSGACAVYRLEAVPNKTAPSCFRLCVSCHVSAEELATTHVNRGTYARGAASTTVIAMSLPDDASALAQLSPPQPAPITTTVFSFSHASSVTVADKSAFLVVCGHKNASAPRRRRKQIKTDMANKSIDWRPSADTDRQGYSLDIFPCGQGTNSPTVHRSTWCTEMRDARCSSRLRLPRLPCGLRPALPCRLRSQSARDLFSATYLRKRKANDVTAPQAKQELCTARGGHSASVDRDILQRKGVLRWWWCQHKQTCYPHHFFLGV